MSNSSNQPGGAENSKAKRAYAAPQLKRLSAKETAIGPNQFTTELFTTFPLYEPYS